MKRCRQAFDNPARTMSTRGILLARRIFRKVFKDSPELPRILADMQEEIDRRKKK